MEVGQNKNYKIGHIHPWTAALLVVVTVLGGGLILPGCDSSTQDWRPWKESKNMELARGQSSHLVAIPPMDIDVSDNIETATFALG